MNTTIKSSQQIRTAFLEFFSQKGHTPVLSSPLVPGNDPTLLFTNAGMVQFKELFLGQEKRSYSKAVSVQRCVRAGGKHNDLENVGYTARHHTFFEMLGNFSFGDYFKRDAIKYAWEFLTQVVGLPAEKLWVTVYKDDLEAEKIWFDDVGIDQTRFSRLGEKDNFWAMGDTGPCGPCSEIFYDHGEDIPGGPPGSEGEDEDRYIEIWNLVFMQYERHADGSMIPLPNPSIDTGMGLERIAAILQGVHSNYEIDTFQHLIHDTAKVVGCQDLENQSLRVIADHIRSCSFMIADGVLPSNEGRGYVLRRIIRRAVRHGFKLGGEQGFFNKLVASLCQVMGEPYPELVESQARIEMTLAREEEQFSRTLAQGMELLEKELVKLSGDCIPGELVFKLYDTFGFPLDLTCDIAREKSLQVDEEGFEKEMNAQKNRSKQSSQFAVDYREGIHSDQKTEFLGYDQLEVSSVIREIFYQGESVTQIEKQQSAVIVLDCTSFYAESGGQVGDKGSLIFNGGVFEVSDTTKSGHAFLHHGHLASGHLKVGDVVDARVESEVRRATALNHSATHLIHAALRQVLGLHVVQKGSMVSSDYLRFDFANPEPVSPQQLLEIEAIANHHIQKNYEVVTQLMTPEKAREDGAMALFGEKYGEEVRVLTMGTFSKELCGGTHVKRTGDIGLVKLTHESGIASGVRRVEGLSGKKAIDYMQKQQQLIQQLSTVLKSNSDNLLDRVEQLQQQLKESQKNIQDMQTKIVLGQDHDPMSETIEIKGIQLLTKQYENLPIKALRDTLDKLKDKLKQGVVILASKDEEKAQIIVGVTKPLCNKLNAGQLVNFLAQQIGGKGGGRPDMAQAGGPDGVHLTQVLDSAKDWIKQNYSS